MARPPKPGLEYFPKDSNMYSDRKIRRLMATHGLKGAVVYDYLLCLIYGGNGYFIRYDSELAFDIADFIGASITEKDVQDVIDSCVTLDLFDRGLYDINKVLTSTEIQERYVVAKRSASILPEFILIEITQVITAETRVNVAETARNETKSASKQGLSTQSKVKESKVNKSRGKEEVSATAIPTYVQDELEDLKKKSNPPELRGTPLTIDDCEEFLRTNQAFRETACMTRKVDMPDYDAALVEFIAEKRVLGHEWKSELDSKRHFLSYLSIWKQKQAKIGTGSSAGKLVQSAHTVAAATKQIAEEGGFYTYEELQNL
ncbi:MAG: DUF4373 domain-containing protein [Dyadobacter sp.]|uniref:DUF4373 domain-containing protein n=1 Tax=Dyadobacter sp. TaxID=1914288 RepID=UPI001AFD8035|nr:DUF4373 domain-containing protein [Dyadobacter sp.]MBO9613401.1 DUF4373 domain-containing protein [Dyadobacter sp.]